jgi:hypothetical protein
MNTPFQLPRGIVPLLDDSDIAFKPAAGYTMTSVSDQKWTHFFRAACSIEDMDSLLAALVDVCLPESFYAILCGHWFDDRIDTYLSDFLPRSQIKSAFSPHLPTLLHDGMVGHGFACYDSQRHEEIFLDDHKELTVLTSVPFAVAEVFSNHGISHDDSLEFLSQHGHVHTNLGGSEAKYCHEIIQKLNMKAVDYS